MGRQCNEVRPGYFFANLDQVKYEAENAIPGRLGVSKVNVATIPETMLKYFSLQ